MSLATRTNPRPFLRTHWRTGVAAGLWLVLMAHSTANGQTVAAGFYSAGQAARGKALYERFCASCHSTHDAGVSEPRNVARIPLAGETFRQRFRTVGDLFAKTRATMPANDAGRLSDSVYADVTAYLLQANGVPPGKSDMPSGLERLHLLLLNGKHAENDDGVGVTNLMDSGYYTPDQAARGRGYFLGNCATCHSPNPVGFSGADAALGRRGVLLGSTYRQFNVITPGFRYPNVFALFTKVRRGMPAHDPGTLSLQTYLDITAFLLQAKGAPAGKSELKYNANAMRSMTFNELGFEKLFNGKDMRGIKFVIGTNCAPQPVGCAQVKPGRAVAVKSGLLVSSGGPEGYFYFDRKFLNFTLRFEIRYVPYPDQETDNDYFGGGGFMLFITEHRVWPKALEVEGAARGLLGANALDSTAKIAVDSDARKKAINPIGQWNAIEIVSKDGKVTGSINGTTVLTVTDLEFKEPGYIGFQIQDAISEWRNIRVKEE
jgi:mono/diheme cytochrome c family protein